MIDDNAANYDCFRMTVGECPESGPFQDAGLTAYRALCDLDREAQKLAVESSMTVEGKRKQLEPLKKKVADAVAQGVRKVELHAAQLGPAEDRLFMPPPIEPMNTVEARADEERRRWFSELGDRERVAVEAELRAGKHDDIVKALARSPVPGPARSLGREVWGERMVAMRGAEVDALRNRRRAMEWATATLQGIARYAEVDPWCGKPAESPVDRMNRARRSATSVAPLKAA